MKARLATFLVASTLAACATTSPTAAVWTKIEGCWVEPTEHWPAYVTWRRDPEHPGGYIGRWQREAAQMDIEQRYFTLTPLDDRMQFCQRTQDGSQRCDDVVFGGGARRGDAALIDVRGDRHEIRLGGVGGAFFWGRRASCG